MRILTLITLLAAAQVAMADAAATKAACASEISKAKCGPTEQDGPALEKCLHSYKQENKGFSFSDACKAALKAQKEGK